MDHINSRRQPLILSLFPGIDILGRGFEEFGATVLRGPDPLFGGTIEGFQPPAGVFDGIIGGPPCQEFSSANRGGVTGEGRRLIAEFLRCVAEASPDWWLLENVPAVPDVIVAGYRVQRFNLNARECGLTQNRNRTFQFGSKDGVGLVIRRQAKIVEGVTRCCLASEGVRKGRRPWPDFCEASGLPRDFELPSFTIAGRYKAVGNGVPLPMARVVAIAVLRRRVTAGERVCVCNCGRPVEGKAIAATPACRKRMERRRRDFAGVTESGPVTATASR